MLHLFIGWLIAIYLLIGCIWSVVLYMRLAPLESKEHCTFWPCNLLLWPLIIFIRSIMRYALKDEQDRKGD